MTSSNPILPQPDILNEQEYGKFVLTNLAAKRAKQLKEGAPPLVRIESSHPLTIALAEIAAGKIKPLMGADAAKASEAQDLVTLEAEDILDVGLLLPALDDEEVAVIGSGILDAVYGLEDHFDDEDDDVEEAHAAAEPDDTLAALLGDEEESDEPDIVASETDDISLDDLAEDEPEHI